MFVDPDIREAHPAIIKWVCGGTVSTDTLRSDLRSALREMFPHDPGGRPTPVDIDVTRGRAWEQYDDVASGPTVLSQAHTILNLLDAYEAEHAEVMRVRVALDYISEVAGNDSEAEMAAIVASDGDASAAYGYADEDRERWSSFLNPPSAAPEATACL